REPCTSTGVEGAERHEGVQIGGAGSRDPNRHRCTAGRDRSETRMDADAGGQTHVDAGRLIVEMTAARADETDGEVAHLPFGGSPAGHALDTLAAVDE